MKMLKWYAASVMYTNIGLCCILARTGERDAAIVQVLTDAPRQAVEDDRYANSKPPRVSIFFVLEGNTRNAEKWRVLEKATDVLNSRCNRHASDIPPIFRNVIVTEKPDVWVIVFARLGNGALEGNFAFSGSKDTPSRIVVLRKKDLADVSSEKAATIVAPQETDPGYAEGVDQTERFRRELAGPEEGGTPGVIGKPATESEPAAHVAPVAPSGN